MQPATANQVSQAAFGMDIAVNITWNLLPPTGSSNSTQHFIELSDCDQQMVSAQWW